MSRAGQRRKHNLSTYLTDLARNEPEKFLAEWQRRLGDWLYEARRRGRSLRQSEKESAAGQASVFGVLRRVNELIESCGAEVETLVGHHTRATLTNECCKALALAVGPHLYNMHMRYDNKF